MCLAAVTVADLVVYASVYGALDRPGPVWAPGL